jgi:hypothetical protein
LGAAANLFLDLTSFTLCLFFILGASPSNLLSSTP